MINFQLNPILISDIQLILDNWINKNYVAIKSKENLQLQYSQLKAKISEVLLSNKIFVDNK